MPSVSDLSRAANILLKVQEHLTQKGQIQHDVDLQSMITLFENPIFRQMVKLQSSLETLNNEAKKENFDPNSVDFSTESGALLIGGEEVKVDNDLKVEDCNVSDFVKDTAHGRQIEEIDLFKYPNESLGFSVVGLRSEHRGDLGIFVQDIKPGGMACRDGRLKESDQILAINDQALSPNVSHQQAIAMLQKSKGLVKLIVARGGFPQSFVGSSRGGSCSSSASDLSSLSQETGVPEMNWSHVETIELTNTGAGLGFGIVGGKATGGVVVKTIVDGGAADVDGRLKSGDHILRIGDTDLTQMNSEQVAVVLRQCGTTVRLVVARTDDDVDEEFESESFTQLDQQQVGGDNEFHPSTTNEQSSSTSSTSSEELAKEFFEVELVKDTKGLGITIHGFLSEDEDNEGETGVFVKSITSGSASDIDGRIRIGDQIIAVDGKRLDGENISSEEAVEILRSTGVVVRLTMARLQGNNFNQQQFSNSRTDDDDDSDERENTEHENDDDEDEDFSGIMSESEEENIRRKWNMVLGGNYEIVVAQLRKFNYTSGLGISLEGTVDFSDTPHHYLRSILPEGPVGRNGKLQAGDELLEVNGNRLLGMNHVEVVVILKELPLAVRMVCARQRHHDDVITRDITRDSVVFEEKDGDFLELKPPQQQPPLPQAPTRVESVTSPGTSSTSSSSEDTISAIKLPEMVPMEHYGVEEKVEISIVQRPSIDISCSESSNHPSPDPYNQPTSADVGDAWHNDIIYIDLMKESSNGLGFSILELPGQEYEQTAIVVRSLLQGGIAEKDGRLEPGDRLLMVNQYDLSQSDLDHAVAILKSVPGGVVKIGVVKPRAQYRANDIEDESEEDDNDIPDVVQNYPPEEEEMRRRSSSSSSSSSLEVQSITPSPLLPPPSVHEAPILQQQSGSNSRVEVKQIQMSGMTAIALTTTSPTPMNNEFTAPHIHPHYEQPTSPSNQQLPPAVPPKPQHYSAPSWQTATVNHPKPPMDGYERIVHMNKGNSNLGISVRPDKDGDGLLVVSIMNGGAVDAVGEPQVGDMIRRVNNDSAVGLGAMQARSLILNHSKFSTQITMCYIPGQYIDAFKRGIPFNEKVISPEKVMAHQSPNRRQHFAQIKSIFESADSVSSDTNSHNSSITSPVLSTSMWGSYQRVEIMKNEDESLGLDIVGGSDEEMPQLSNGETLQGVYVRSIEAGGPLARDGRIKTGDKILKIGTFDLTNATHAEAIEAFSQQHTPRTTFIVQSFISRSIKKTAATASAAPPSGSEDNEDDVILRKYEHIEGDKRVVRLVKGPNGLGISMAGSKEKKVFVVGVKPDGEAGRNGKIKVGDQLLEINDHPLDGANNNQVARQLISECQSTLVMVICRQGKPKTVDESSSDGEVKTIKLVKDFQGLGFSIQPCDEGICIKSIARDGTAERDGRLKARDLLLAVDDQPLVGVSCETATSILKQARGVVKLQVKTPTSGDTSSLPHGSRSSSGHLGSRSSSSGIDLLTCPIEAGCETTIEISKGKSGLGVSIVGGRDSLLNSILVHTVYEEGAAAKDGRLWPGDRILWVNEHDIRNATHDEAIDILWKAAGRVRLVVIRDEHRDTINNQTDEDIYNLHEVTLVKKKGLGLSIIGRRNHPGVYISDLIEGGVAQKEGTMKKGDHILKINGKDVKFASQETVASLLKNAREEVVIMVGRSKSGMMPDDIIQPSPSSSSLLLQQPDVVIPKEELALLSYTSKDREEHQIRFVEIHKEIPAQPLGVSIAGGMNSPLGDVPIFVAMIQQSGPAASQLNVGDIILSVNGRSTDGKTHDDVVQMLKGSDDMIVLMQVRDGGDEVHKLSEYLKDATSNVNEMISTWDPSIKDINQRSNNEAIDIELHRGNDGLGISIAGGYGSPHGNIPIFVKTVSKVGAAADEGRLKKGDQIVSVNGEDLNGYTHEEAAEALRRKTNLIILRVIPS